VAHRPLVISAVSRTPQANGPPILIEIDGFVAPSGITLTETLNQPDQLSFSIVPVKQEPTVLARFKNLAAAATEIWAFCDDCGLHMFAGPLLGYAAGLKGDAIVWQVKAAGMLDYLRRWRIEPDGASLVYTNQDQTVIAKGLIDYYQALSYGNYGIVTTGLANTGVLRDRTYPAIEGHLIAQRLSELAAVNNGFDFSVTPATRQFNIHYPFQGTDRTNAVVIDGRSIVDPSAQISAGPEDLVSEGFALGDGGLIAHRSNTTLRAAIGRSGFVSSFNGVVVQATLNDHAQRLVDQRSTQLHDPAKTLVPVGLDWDDFDLGDRVEYAYDYGAGVMVEQRRVYARSMNLADTGVVKIGVQLI
jgi:hypothetical protein